MDAAENLFVPVCIYNNTKGDSDEKTRLEFKEPAWNNPVTRILNADKKDIVARNDRGWTVAAVARTMVEALEAGKTEVPAWLKLLDVEGRARAGKKIETAVFGMA